MSLDIPVWTYQSINGLADTGGHPEKMITGPTNVSLTLALNITSGPLDKKKKRSFGQDGQLQRIHDFAVVGVVEVTRKQSSLNQSKADT